jgi:hypothetical protein
MERIVINVITGIQTRVPLTQKEIDAINDVKDTPAPVPQVISMRQARLALLSAGLLSQVDDAVQTMKNAEGDTARIEWEYSGAVRRDWPLVTSLAVSLGLTDKQIDDLFILAATL